MGNIILNAIFVLGRPGSGKGTQCLKICEEFHCHHLSAGDLLRQERAADPQSKFKEELDKHFEDGTMVSPQITVTVLKNAIQKLANPAGDKGTKRNLVLIDGFPPNLDNFVEWEKQMDGICSLKFVLLLDASEEICMKRCLQRGRVNSAKSNDTVSNIRRRFSLFNDGVMPLVQNFGVTGTVVDANGESMDQIFDNVRKCFEKFFQK